MVKYENLKDTSNEKYFKSFPFSEEIWNDNYRGPGEKTVIESWKRFAEVASLVEKQNK